MILGSLFLAPICCKGTKIFSYFQIFQHFFLLPPCQLATCFLKYTRTRGREFIYLAVMLARWQFFVYYSRIIFGYPRLSTLNTSGFAASSKLKNARKVHFSCIFQKKVVSLQIKNLLRSTIDNRILINYKNRVNETNIFVISSIIATYGDG